MRPPDPSRLNRVTAARIESPASSTHTLHDEPAATYMKLSGPITSVRVPWTPFSPSTNRLTVKPRGTYSAWPAMRIVSCPPSDGGGGGGGGGGGRVLSSAGMAQASTAEASTRSRFIARGDASRTHPPVHSRP